MKRITILLIMFTAFAFQAKAQSDSLKAEPKNAYGSYHFDLDFKSKRVANLAGDSVPLVSPSKKYTIIDFWFAACVPCKKTKRDLDSFYLAHADHHYAIHAFNPVDHKNTINAYLQINPVRYEVLTGDRSLQKEMNCDIFPLVLIVDANGKLQRTFMGYHESFYKNLSDFFNDK